MDEQREENRPDEESDVEGHARPLADKTQVDDSDDEDVEAHSLINPQTLL